ncbi:hypothetical protein [Streptomyces sp. BE230]|uniref:hypothetical protein n=1 Tax=Streptomyces sp. BE230 TaxID=3002526 RepID=UPI002ED574CD|nr:hypothetical protein [Streptomyces sp. BE230]
MVASSRDARDELRNMLKAAGEEAVGRPLLADVIEESGIAPRTWRGWCEGRAVPSPALAGRFLVAVGRLRGASGSSVYPTARWEAALRAAREEASGVRGGQILAMRRETEPCLRFVRLHGPALEATGVEVRGRTDERTEMNSFVRDSRAEAPSYLCWYADAPVGKTLLLADYVGRRPPAGIDILTFFVSAGHGTNTRAEFEKEVAYQIDDFLGGQGNPVPGNSREWRKRFAEAAAKSAGLGRRLLLVIDGLDDDVAWAGAGAESAPSIAALLPARPPSGMRVIVSLRRWGRFPDDLPPVRHPLRRRRYLRALSPVAGVRPIRQPAPDATALGEQAAGLLAVAGGGLRAADLAELTGLSVDHVDRLVHGPAGRALVADDPVSRTYALADLSLARAVREALGEEGVPRYSRQLLAWSQRYRAAGWPDGTPPFPLEHQLRLLTDAGERAAYIVDVPRLRRLAHTTGPDVALAQLEDFETEVGGPKGADSEGLSAAALATLVSLCAARCLLVLESYEVPDGAASLFVRLGYAERARGLARSAPTAIARAVHLADVAVELSYAGRGEPEVAAVVGESAELLVGDHVRSEFPDNLRDPESRTRLLAAARTLTTLNSPDVARPLIRAVLQDPAAGTEALVEAARMLDPERDRDVVETLWGRAETLSEGGMRARAAAADLWGALARAVPSRGPDAGNRIEAVCEEIDDTDGLASVDVLASAASALAALPAKRPRAALKLMRRALVLARSTIEALKNPASLSAGSLSEEDSAHLRRELAGTLAHLAKSVADTGGMKADLDDMRQLMEALPDGLRIGNLGDSLVERAQWVMETTEDDKKRRDRAADAAGEETRRAGRRSKDAERQFWAMERKRRAEAKEGRVAPRELDDVQRESKARRPSAAPRSHRRSSGLPSPGDGPRVDARPSLLLLEAEAQLAAGNLSRSLELVETVLRKRPAIRRETSLGTPPLAGDWTVDLCQAMGTAGLMNEGEALAHSVLDTHDRARHLAALSLGCSLAGHDGPAARHARAAADLVSDDAAPELANAVAQAVAHTGDEPLASALVRGRTSARRQALTAVAAGLLRHCPEGAARVAMSVAKALGRRIDAGMQGNPLNPLPELAALLLAFPDPRRPDPLLTDALLRTAVHMTAPSMPQPAPAMAVLALLERLGCLPDEAAEAAGSRIDTWRRSLRPGQGSSAELALLAAVEGDISAVWRHADAASIPEARQAALCAAAAHLAGALLPLAVDARTEGRAVRTCLALARASDGINRSGGDTARRIALGLLRADVWTHTIPLLPQLAPEALGHLGTIAMDARLSSGGSAGRDACP